MSGAWWLGPVAVALLAAIAVFAFRPVPDPAEDTDNLMAAAAFDRLLRREATPLELSISRGTEPLAVRELATSDPKVRLYSLETAE